MQGIVNLDKPPGMSSARAVSAVKRLLPRGTKIGHAGTLDPFATGVLLLLIGKATKSCERLMNEPKRYEATLKLGATTATDDPEAAEEPWPRLGIEPPARASVEAVLTQFMGQVAQRPPAFSAMKVAGRRAYELARKGHAVKLEPRTIRIDAIELLDYTWPLMRLRIDCGRGTYVRSLARDIGEALDTGAYLTQLRRTRVGPFVVEESVTLAQLAADGVENHVKPHVD